MSELKPCPACGGEAKYDTIRGLVGAIRCTDCDLTGKGLNCEVNRYWERLVEIWNNQPRIDKLEQQLKEAKEALKPFAQYACKPLNSCGGCNNCKAQQILEVKK